MVEIILDQKVQQKLLNIVKSKKCESFVSVGFSEELHSGWRCHELGGLADVSTGLQNTRCRFKVRLR